MANAISTITLCKVPLSPVHQIDFDNKTEQLEYFRSNAKHTFDKCRYQPRTSTIKVKGYVDTLMDCNYGYYVNTYRGTTKTFFFWIVSKNFLARETTEIVIQLDVFQTWLFDIHLAPCMIEREHVSNDEIGSHTLPEDFELGDYISHNRQYAESLTGDPCYFIGLTDADEGINGGIFGKTYSGFSIKYYDYNDTDELSSFIQSLMEEGKADSIAFIFTFPKKMLSGSWTSGTTIVGSEGIEQKIENLSWQNFTKNFAYKNESHTPYNNKLYTYPYNFITIKNSSGANVILKLELFEDINNIQLYCQTVLTQTPTISLTPGSYSGKTLAYEDSISLQDYGLCSWNNDNYANWYASHVNSISAQSMNASISANVTSKVNSNNYSNRLENRNTQLAKGGLSTAISTLSALGSGNLLGAGANALSGGVNNMLDYNQATRNANNDLSNSEMLNNTSFQNEIRSIVASVKDAQVQPNTARGDTSATGLDLARGTATFIMEQTTIKPEYARIIDMYWQMFGYQVNRVSKPNFKTRQKWNYIKTVNCHAYGEIPHEDTDAINEMFNNGLTIWHDESYMFEYDTVNNIL